MVALPLGIHGGYPTERAETPWPREHFEQGLTPPGVDLEPLFEELFVEQSPLGTTHAALIVHQGKIVAERYNGALGSFVGEPTPVEPSTPLLSWSMAKTMIGVVVGMLVTDGLLDLDAPAAVPEWSSPGDPRGAITLRNLMEMRDGLDFAEEYSDTEASDVIEMLYGSGQGDMAHFAADRELAATPGTRYNYSSGTTNIISRLCGDVLGGQDAMAEVLATRLFGPLSMRNTTPSFDDAGTFIASSFVHATAQDFARFGLLLCRGGVADGARLVPESWVDMFRTPVSIDDDDRFYYSSQCWVVGDDLGTFWASGFEGQMISVCPPLDLVVVRLGQTTDSETYRLKEWRNRVTDAFRASLSG